MTDMSFTTELNSETVETKCRQLVYDIERVEHAAMEFGTDPQAFVIAFGEENRALAEGFVKTWEEAKKKFLDVVRPISGPIPDCSLEIVKEAMQDFLNTVERENRHFLLAAIDLYHAEIRRVLGGTEDGNRC